MTAEIISTFILLYTEEENKKIEHLRSTYLVEVNNIKKSMQSDAGNGIFYKTYWSWFNEMNSFIKFKLS